MQKIRGWALLSVLLLGSGVRSWAQQSASAAGDAAVPTLVQFSGVLANGNGKPLTGLTGVTFSLYAASEGGAPLWLETQNVQPDKAGNYSVMLGSTTSQGLPSSLFVSGQARWLGVRPQGQAEQPRVMLMSVPYALKAADAQTVGGLPPSAFVLAAAPTSSGGAANGSTAGSSGGSAQPNPSSTGTQNYIPIWTDNSGDLGNSVIYQTGTGSKAKIGINTTSPGSTLDVKGGSTVRGLFSLPATNTATVSQGYSSQPQRLQASSFNSNSVSAVTQNFQWQAESINNDTANASGTLNLLFGQGSSTPAETGLNIASNGQITFANGQTFPGVVTEVGSGAGLTGGPITSTGTLSIATGGVTNSMLANPALTVAAGTDLTGGGLVPLGGSTTLSLDTTKVPQLGTANSFTGNQSVTGNVSATGMVSAPVVNASISFDIAGAPFAFGSQSAYNAFLGFAGNATTTGEGNTAVGVGSLAANTTGGGNTSVGYYSLPLNTAGGGNTSVGYYSLPANTTGYDNTSLGYGSLTANTTGWNNVAAGADAGENNTTGSGNTAVGVAALLTNVSGSSNTAIGDLALPSTAGSNNVGVGASAGNNVTTSPSTGSNNTFVGGNSNTAKVVTVNNATALGANTIVTGLSNATVIGANASVTASNALILGGTGSNAVQVGIGTTAPISFLDVEATVQNPRLGPTITLTNNAGGGQLSLDFNTYPVNLSGYNPSSRILVGDDGNYGNNIYFQSNKDGAANNGLNTNVTFLSNGYVGIGITSPSYLLHVGNGNNGFRVEGPAQGSNSPVLASFGGSGDFAIDAVGIHGGRFVVKDSTGFVGIGTVSPDSPLSVNGNADKPGGGSWGTFSDRRLKNLDGSFNAGLSQILKINPVRYRYKADNGMGIRDQEQHVGLVAQEVQKVIPEAVTENSKGYLLVNNDPILWTMLNAIKEQQKLIQRQQQRIAQLTSQVKAIQASLKTNGRTGSEIRTVKVPVPVVRQ